MIDYILKQEGDQKRDYSDAKFIGDPVWVVAKYNELKAAMRERRKFIHPTSHPLSNSPP